ncbi:DUF2235 domain-containing protein [Lichenihabitans sp. PAMC28606]|uniref:phospholipase effector Tle1 domain-containing protein n=1 Tax=Lichenihabitans sp. PAMC28606 TaxID=2880932 RepID=UPI001D0A3071|nr:DUF2235 domain-containing protein [Lichenihabitans sp. PAMC28606]UDL96233.1 DUF2235 domain-containing protein [Lichenihabitans sp. PAMC28606]
MGKRILVFADGTGNEGGLLPDESRTNVYKLYRATRTGPDSTVNPHEQLAFYVQGVGTSLPGHAARFHGAKETVQQMIGLGLKDRIRACYKAIIGTWRPGDSIYLFGFSRGAYTARCVAHVLEVFGIPSREPGSDTLSLDPKRLDAVARRAVDILYRVGFMITNNPKRQAEVAAFTRDYAPHMGAADGVVPYFLGLWDSVAAYGLGKFFPQRYDAHLPHEIQYVRHALSIDENRRDFKRVIFGGSRTVRQALPGEPEPFQQVWFAGNHSDIGGSYPENESRLSDITLQWMLDFLTKGLPEGKRITFDEDVLKLYPSFDGMMHDECQSSKVRWLQAPRVVDAQGTLHDSVIERLKLDDAREYSGYKPYRPEPLRFHPRAAPFFTSPAPPAVTSWLRRITGPRKN